MLNYKTFLIFLIISGLFLNSCEKSEPEAKKSGAKSILGFSFNEIIPAVKGTIHEDSLRISLIVPRNTDIKNLVPTIEISEGASITPSSGVANNFTDNVKYTVVAEDGTEKMYDVEVIVEKNGENEILEFRFEEFEPNIIATIAGNTVSVTFPWDIIVNPKYNIDSLAPVIKISEGATIEPASGQINDFSQLIIQYIVTAENGAKNYYTVDATIEDPPPPSVEEIGGIVATIGDTLTIHGTYLVGQLYCTLRSEKVGISHDRFEESINSFKIAINHLVNYDKTYDIEVIVRDSTFIIGQVTIPPQPPEITAISKTSYDDNDILEIKGARFSDSGNFVYFIKDGKGIQAYIKEEKNYRIYVIIPPFIESGDYYIKIETADGKEAVSQETVSVIQNTSNDAIMTGVNKNILKNGDSFEIYGKNFEIIGSDVYINFMDGWSSTKILTGKVISDNKIVAAIDTSIVPAGETYEIGVYIGYTFSTERKRVKNWLYNISIIE